MAFGFNFKGYAYGSAAYTVEKPSGESGTVIAQSPCGAMARFYPNIVNWRSRQREDGWTEVQGKFPADWPLGAVTCLVKKV